MISPPFLRNQSKKQAELVMYLARSLPGFIAIALFGLLSVSCGSLPESSSLGAPGEALEIRASEERNHGGSSRNESRFRTASLALPSGGSFPIRLLFSAAEHRKGLSGMREADFPDGMGMFFWFSESAPRRFWMPDTWFDLDIVFLDEDLGIIYVARNMQAHPGWETPPPIARTPVIFSRYVLEVKANSAVSKELRKGKRLIWNTPWSLEEIESRIDLLR
uniref:Uncharacterized conserved membrane protein, UPF0127 family n=1 Tax=Candidatus Kentrum sp. LPFa TaxID=2126335 RepID=A0A450XAG7_9GAMM|nr:MAG: Uncharacterized conserved membrane protein, UPF0127 family [Candidatus Kentron sp. LPFa]VFK26266.1 MAG: Uncharacterized conserved membrane protein, UPF0127 family [Candidatus Kentron sp. LPFa]